MFPLRGKFRNQENCFGICRKRSLVQRCADGTKSVTYCHSCTRMYSHAGIVCAVDIRRTRSFDRSVTMLEFMAALCREGEDSHSVCSTLLPVWTNANRGCLATQLLLCIWKAWHVLRNVLHIFQKILCHLLRWMDRVSDLLNVPSVQWQCWWGAFYVSLSYPVAVYCQNMKRHLKILRRTLCWPSIL